MEEVTYCREQLQRGGGGEELSFEELRAENYTQKQEQVDEKLSRLSEEEEELSPEEEEEEEEEIGGEQELLPTSSEGPPTAASFLIYDEFPSDGARPAGKSKNELQDDVFLPPNEQGLCVKVQCPRRPGAAAPSELHQIEDLDPSGLQNLDSAPGHQGETIADLQTRLESRSPTYFQKRVRKKLSPIEETSVDALSLTSLTSLGSCSRLEEDQEDQEGDCTTPTVPGGGAVDPCDPDIRRRLLDLCGVISSPDLHLEPRPIPAVEEHSVLQLGGDMYYIYSRLLDENSFSVFKGDADDKNVLLKVDSCAAPWDFYQFTRLKKNNSSASSLPLISCFLFMDGCITVYATPPDYLFTELKECVSCELSVGYKAISLLQLVLQLHSCRLVHAALQPNTLACCHRGLHVSDSLFPVDWSSSVDLDLQQDVRSVQQIPTAQAYISLGLLEPTAPPQLVDLVGVAESVHLLLTNSRMVLVRDADGWTAESFSGDDPSDMYTRMWRRFFHALLNAGGGSALSVLSELKEALSALYC